MKVLGLNAFHGDAAACLVVDGKIIAAAEEERFRRIKHWAGFPSEAIKYCIAAGNVALSDIEHVAINQDRRANLWHKIAFTLANRPSMSLVHDRIKNRRARASLFEHFKEIDDRFCAGIHAVEHHRAHLASAFYPSPFDNAVAVSVDGFGDFSSAAWGYCSNGEIRVDQRVLFPHSLGIFYQAMTQYLGFFNYGDEYKVMGLAPYGQPRYLDKLREMVGLKNNGLFELNLRFFRHHRERISHTWDGGSPEFDQLYSPKLEQLLGKGRRVNADLTDEHRDIARSTQAMYEEAFFHILNFIHAKYQTDNLVLSGGCAMNSVANGKVFSNSPFKHLYVQSAAGDAGGAIGAAFELVRRLEPLRALEKMSHAYLGPEFSDIEIENILSMHDAQLNSSNCAVIYEADQDKLLQQTVSIIIDGGVVGWFQGRMEWGPRALGNRSILGDPRRTDMKEILNLKIKRRESFRPFAPSVLREHVIDWFEVDTDVPFMMKVFPIREEKRALIPAVTHVDGTGRLQTVDQSQNDKYYRLITTFYQRTGVPMLLNTSFNENEPVVCSPSEALDCFLRTRMDLLVMGNWTIRRSENPAE